MPESSSAEQQDTNGNRQPQTQEPRSLTDAQLTRNYLLTVLGSSLFVLALIGSWVGTQTRSTGIPVILSAALAVASGIIVGLMALWRHNIFPVWMLVIQILNLVGYIILDFAWTYWGMSARAGSCMNVSLTKIDSVYFTLTTLTTVGYGDITPVSQSCRAVVSGQMIVGLIMIGVIVALLVVRISENRSNDSLERALTKTLDQMVKNGRVNVESLKAVTESIAKIYDSLQVNNDERQRTVISRLKLKLQGRRAGR